MVAKKQILIVGVGGLGIPAARALSRAGVADLALIDPDAVELSNLPRQVIFGEAEIGESKALAAARCLVARHPGIRVEPILAALGPDNAAALLARFDFVVDATDSPAAKFLINDVCIRQRVPFAYGGVLGLTGQALTVIPGRTACLRCIFEEPPDESESAGCREAGIIGPAAGAIGAAQAAEALTFLSGRMPALAGAMLTLDGSKTGRVRLIPIAARVGCGCGAAATTAAAGATDAPAR